MTPIMEHVARHFGKTWAPNTRETVRRFTLHQFVQAGLVIPNPDKPDRPTNSPHFCYQVAPRALTLLRTWGTPEWSRSLPTYLSEAGSLRDAYAQWLWFDDTRLAQLGVSIESHGKMPDVVVHDIARNWLVLIEAVTSHGPINPLRHRDLTTLFGVSTAGLVFVSAFSDRATFREYAAQIAWETEVWTADFPDHMVHFNGERFLGPY